MSVSEWEVGVHDGSRSRSGGGSGRRKKCSKRLKKTQKKCHTTMCSSLQPAQPATIEIAYNACPKCGTYYRIYIST